MFRTGSGYTAGKNFTPLSRKTTQTIRILVVNLKFLGAEFAHLFLEIDLSFSATAIFAIAPGVTTAIAHGIAAI